MKKPSSRECDELHCGGLPQCDAYRQKKSAMFYSADSQHIASRKRGGTTYSHGVRLRTIHVSEEEVTEFDGIETRQEQAPLRSVSVS